MRSWQDDRPQTCGQRGGETRGSCERGALCVHHVMIAVGGLLVKSCVHMHW
jgi:hypothetical protein